MPKQPLHIPSLSKGLIGNASPRDIPSDAMSYGENVDSRVHGRVQGIPGNTSENGSFDARVMDIIVRGDRQIVGQDKDGQFKRYDIDADTVSNIGSSVGTYAKSMVPISEEAYVGMTTSFRGEQPATPRWVGRISHFMFGDGLTPYSLASDISASATQFDVSGGVDAVAEAGQYLMVGTFGDYELMAVTNVSGSQPSTVTVDRGAGHTSAQSHSSGDEVKVVIAADDEYVSEPSELDVENDWDWQINNVSWNDSDSEDAYFNQDKSYFWAISFIYDGFQESQLLTEDKLGAIVESSPSDSDARNVVFDIQVEGGEDVSRRITGINLYRASGNISSEPDTQYRFVDHFNISGKPGDPNPIWSPINTTYQFGFQAGYNDVGETGATYEDNTGVSEAVGLAHVDYGINVEYGGFMFVANCSHPDIGEASKYIFRSKPKAFSIIDWSTDFVRLPEEPTALVGFGGRLFAFSESSMYRINPNSMVIEDVFQGVGALNENMVVATNYGMFHADENNVYINDGRTSQPIGTTILTVQQTSDPLGWQEMDKTDAAGEHYASMGFDAENRRLLLFGQSSGTTTVAWAYDVQRERWDLYNPFEIPSSVAQGVTGTLYVTTGDTSGGFSLESLFTASSRKTWKVVTKDLGFESDSGWAWVYKVNGYGSGSYTIGYYRNGSGSLQSPGTTDDNELRMIDIPDSDQRCRSFQVEVSAGSGSDELDNLVLVIRPSIVRR